MAKGMPEGITLSAKALLHLGERAAVDQALCRLTREGKLLRVGRGIYAAPITTRFGTRAPAPEKVVETIAQTRGETIVPSGATEANALGLTTQVPVKLVYLTSGRSRSLRFGAQTVTFRHAPTWQLLKGPGSVAGQAVRALAWLGPEHAGSAMRKLVRTLPRNEIENLRQTRAALPTWLAKTVSSASTLRHA
jgi:hypothetical protein